MTTDKVNRYPYILFALLAVSLGFRGGSIGIGSIKPLEGLLLIMFPIYAKRLKINSNIIFIWLILVCSHIIGSAISYNRFPGYIPMGTIFLNIVEFGVCMMLFVIFSSMARNEKYFKAACDGLIFSGIVVSLLAIYEIITSGRLIRVSTTFNDPNYFASYLLLPTLLSISSLIWGDRKLTSLQTALYFGTAILSICVILLTYSRGGLIGLAVGLIALIFIKAGWGRPFTKKLFIWFLLAGMACSIIGFVVIRDTDIGAFMTKRWNVERMTSVKTNSRLMIWTGSLNLIKHNPWGVGVGNFVYLYQKYSVVPDIPRVNHNIILEIISEIGVLGGGAFLLFAGFLVLNSIFVGIRREPDAYWVGIVASFTALLTQGMTLDMLLLRHLWVVLGLILAQGHNRQSD